MQHRNAHPGTASERRAPELWKSVVFGLLPWLLAGCSTDALTRELVVGPFPAGSCFMDLEKETPDGWVSVGVNWIDASFHDKRGRLVGAEDIPGRHGTILASEGWVRFPAESGGEFLVLALDSQRRWWIWTSCSADQERLPDAGEDGQDRYVVDVRRCPERRQATEEELDRFRITVGRDRPLFEDPGIGKLPSSREYYQENSEFLLRAWRRYLGRCVGLAEKHLGENRALDASAAVADALSFLDLSTPVRWSDAVRAAAESVYSEFLAFRDASEKGDRVRSAEALGRIRAQLEVLDTAK